MAPDKGGQVSSASPGRVAGSGSDLIIPNPKLKLLDQVRGYAIPEGSGMKGAARCRFLTTLGRFKANQLLVSEFR